MSLFRSIHRSTTHLHPHRHLDTIISSRSHLQSISSSSNIISSCTCRITQSFSRPYKILASDVRAGNLIEHDGKLLVVISQSAREKGRGGTIIQMETKDIKSNAKIPVRVQKGERVEKVDLTENRYQFLYRSGDTLNLMDNVTYEQIELSSSVFGNAAPYLQEGQIVKVQKHQDTIVSAALHPSERIVCTVTECSAAKKGLNDAGNKEALLHNGVRIEVPQYIGPGNHVLVDTSNNTFISRSETPPSVAVPSNQPPQ